MIFDKLESFIDERGYAPSTGELRDYITGDRVCSPATYFRALAKAREDGVVTDAREIRDGTAVRVLRFAKKEEAPRVPAVPQFVQPADDDEPL